MFRTSNYYQIRLKIITYLFLLVLPSSLFSQLSKTTAIGLNFGTKALPGIDIAFQVSERMNIKVGFNYMTYAIRDYDTNFNRYEHYVIIDGDIRHNSFELLAEHTIFKNKIRVVLGAAYFPENKMSGKVQLRDDYRYNQLDVKPEEIGGAGGSLSYKSPVSPYIGIAWGSAIPKRRIGFSMNIGTYYKGKPQIEVVGTGLLRHNDVNGPIIEDGISSYRWWPMLSFRLAYKLSSLVTAK